MSKLKSLLVAATAISHCYGYSAPPRPSLSSQTSFCQNDRRKFFGKVASSSAAAIIACFGEVKAVAAEELDTPGVPSRSIEKCSTSSKAPCVSTANVRNLDLYLPPWTFEQSADEAMARLKGAIEADPGCKITQQDGNQYLKVEAQRNDLFNTVDEIEFIINANDQVVFFRSRGISNENNDFGFNKKRLGQIRSRAGIFGVMGEAYGSADSATTDQRGNGPLGQLKAFYGLQSGSGFEDVVLE